jgi:sulfofructose kinase
LGDAAAARVICLGLATLDAIARVERLPRSDERLAADDGVLAGGGVAATAAVALARLGVPVAFGGCVGDDRAGESIRDGLADEGVDVGLLRTRPGRSPFTIVLVEREIGARSLVPVASDVAGVDVDRQLMAACRDASWIHLDHVGYAALRSLRSAGVTTPVSLDGGNPIADLALDDIDLYAPTETALQDRYPGRGIEDALVAALGEGPRVVVATRGGRGSIAAVRDSDGAVRIEHGAAPAVAAVSTLGAGDVFHGALLAALLDGGDVRDAMVRANAAAAMSCTALDGRSAIPSRAELEAFLDPSRAQDVVAGR